MGLFGGSKSSTTNLNEEFNLSNVDNRIIEGGGAAGGNVTIGVGGNSDNLYVTTTDFGALDAASEAIDRSFVSVDNAVSAVQTMATDAGVTVGNALKKVSDFATAQTGQDENKTVQYLILAVGAVGLIWAFRRK